MLSSSEHDYNIVAERGFSFSISFTWLDENEKPVDLITITSAAFIIYAGKEEYLKFTLIHPELSVDKDNVGTFLFRLSETKLNSIEIGYYSYSLLVWKPDKLRLLKGGFQVAC